MFRPDEIKALNFELMFFFSILCAMGQEWEWRMENGVILKMRSTVEKEYQSGAGLACISI